MLTKKQIKLAAGGIPALIAHIREQDAAMDEAREFVELTATLTPCTPNQYMRAQTWVKVYDAAHPAPKETP